MKPVLIQSILHHRKRQKSITETNLDPVHGGHRDRSGFIVLVILIISVVIAMALS